MDSTASAAADLFTPGFVADPHPTYAALREAGPVHRIELPGGIPAWLVTRYEQAKDIFMDTVHYSKDLPGTWRAFQEQRVPMTGDVIIGMGDSMLVSDPPRHTRLRSLVAKAFTPRRIEALAPSIAEAADDILTGIAGRAADRAGHADLVADFAHPLPMRVICDLFGVPQADGPMLGDAAATIMSNDSASQEAAFAAFQRVHGYLAEHVEITRGGGADNFTTALIEAHDEGDRLSSEELVAMLALLLSAGHETTVNLLGNAVNALVTHPDELRLVLAEPSRWPDVVEEVLRWDGSIQNAIWRFTKIEVTVGAVTIPAGEAVALSVAAANRDPDRYADPDRFDVRRRAGANLAFGHGIHHCLGAPLARLEARIALPMVFDRLPGLALDGAPRYRPSTVSRALATLPVRFGGR